MIKPPKVKIHNSLLSITLIEVKVCMGKMSNICRKVERSSHNNIKVKNL